MKTAVLRLYRGDDAATPDESGTAASRGDGADPVAAPRVLPFPSRAISRRDADETARRESVDEGGRPVTLRFHAPHDTAGGRVAAADERPDVLPLSAILSPPQFRRGASGDAELPAGVAGRIGGWAVTPPGVAADSPLTRAKALHANRTCKSCGAGGVEPVLLSDGVRDASGQLVPGSGTLVGFHCCRCQKEWPVA
ncbi:hypothetical protein [Alienimonas californiensis]|uniref:Uncharacterized protein n=1 Tax=Alienimonas californiensis TaxID=2527989 RepID=A0A517P4Q2_9PLAN|nr:hypothetical protein [Alienimonas californiensis]QDT14367.1 hypothetical protein CA12_04400 [Alienimonas californiensis]